MQKAICVIGSSSTRASSQYSEAAAQLGRLIAQNGWTLVCGGANSGLILTASQSAQQHGGKVVAVVPQVMVGTQYIYENADEVIVADDISSRKAEMMSRSDAFMVLPGGIGTLDEIFTILAMKQFRMLPKPIVLIDVNGFLDRLKDLMQWLETENFISEGEFNNLCLRETSVESAVNRLRKQIETIG